VPATGTPGPATTPADHRPAADHPCTRGNPRHPDSVPLPPPDKPTNGCPGSWGAPMRSPTRGADPTQLDSKTVPTPGDQDKGPIGGTGGSRPSTSRSAIQQQPAQAELPTAPSPGWNNRQLQLPIRLTQLGSNSLREIGAMTRRARRAVLGRARTPRPSGCRRSRRRPAAGVGSWRRG